MCVGVLECSCWRVAISLSVERSLVTIKLEAVMDREDIVRRKRMVDRVRRVIV